MRLGIAYNLKTDSFPSVAAAAAEDAREEFDSLATIEALERVFSGAGHRVSRLGGDLALLEKARREQVEFVFNIAEGFTGRSREAHVPALLEMAAIPYSGSDPLALALTLDKALTKRVAVSLGIPTPAFWIADRAEDLAAVPARFPLFVKPVWQGSSKGVRLSSCARDRGALEAEAERILRDYGEPVLVEDYIAGREVTCGVLGNENPEVLGLMEIVFRDRAKTDFCYSLETKRNWQAEVDYLVPAPLDKKTAEGIERAARLLFRTLGLRDVARFDFRVDSAGGFHFLEVNPLPGLSPESGDLVILAGKKGLSHEALVLRILGHALSRYR